MRIFACDWCGRPRNAGERWLLGFAAERIGAAGVQREMSMAGGWSDSAAEHPLAVHFCSAAHRNAYIEALFSEIPRTNRAVRRKGAGATAQRSGSTISLGLGGCALQSQEQPESTPRRRAKGRMPSKQKAGRPAPARFDIGDSIRSHGMGVRLDHEFAPLQDPCTGN